MPTLYKKVGRRYVPAGHSFESSIFTEGSHVVVCKPGVKHYIYNVDPYLAPLIAASMYAREKIGSAIYAARTYELDIDKKIMTDEQIQTWNRLVELLEDRRATLTVKSADDAATEGLQVLAEEADKLLKVPAVKKAFEQFMTLCQLTLEKKNDPF